MSDEFEGLKEDVAALKRLYEKQDDINKGIDLLLGCLLDTLEELEEDERLEAEKFLKENGIDPEDL